MVEEIDDDRRVVAAATADPTGPPMRASDAERAAVADRLHAALAQGRLDIGETEDRLAAAYAARHRSDLQPLVADLPAAEAGALAAGWRRVWQLIVEQAWLSSAAARGSQPAPPDRRQRRAATALLVTAAVWALGCLLLGYTVGLLG